VDERLRMSPSSADRWSACPGSVTLSIGKRSKTERYSAEGTVAHALLADCLTFDVDPSSSLGQVKSQDGFEITIDQEMVDGVRAALLEIQELVKTREDWTWMVESELRSNQFPTKGFVDYGLISPDKTACVIFDFKYGAGVLVPIENNPQVSTYGVMLQELYPQLKEFLFCVVQPRARTGPTIKYWSATDTDIGLWRDSMYIAEGFIEQAHEVRSDPVKLLPLLTSGEHCRFCPSKPECPRLQKHVFESLAIPKSEIREFGATECREWLDRLDDIENWCKAVRGRAYQLLEDGEPIVGWKLVASEGNRAWARPTNEVIDVLRAAGFARNKVVEEKILSPAQVEKLKLPGKLSKVAAKELVASLVKRPLGDPKLTRDTDTRKEISGGGVAEDFAEPPQGV